MKSCGIHLRAISHEMLKIATLDVSLKITNLRLHPHLPGTNELSITWWFPWQCSDWGTTLIRGQTDNRYPIPRSHRGYGVSIVRIWEEKDRGTCITAPHCVSPIIFQAKCKERHISESNSTDTANSLVISLYFCTDLTPLCLRWNYLTFSMALQYLNYAIILGCQLI